jgi:hypothetical protein
MRRLSWLLLVTLVTFAFSDASAGARVSPRDAAATHAYLEARIALQRAGTADEPADLQAIEALAAQVKVECPGVLSGAPSRVKGEKTNQSEVEVSEELLSASLGATGRVEHPADARFARTVERLRWSNPRLTRLLRSLAREEAEQSEIQLPDLCSDMKFWVASDYTAVSAGTKRYLHRLRVVSSTTQIELEPHEPVSNIFHLTALIAHRLERYEDRADRLLAKKALPPEAKITDPAVRRLLEAAGKVFIALERTSAAST